MTLHRIPNPRVLKEEIRKSHERSRRYGIDPNCVVDPGQARLTSHELAARVERMRTFFDVAVRQLNELDTIISGGFAMILADHEGYILSILADPENRARLARINCAEGFRWSERDVGTTSIALSLARRIPVQITENESFCRRGRGFTNSAAPVFDDQEQLLGTVVATGRAEQVHPHTLGMMITAARAIENELRIRSKSRELSLQNQSMKAVLESIDRGLIVLDREGRVVEINDHGKAVLKGRDLIGTSIQKIARRGIDWEALLAEGGECVDRELFLAANRSAPVQAMATIRPIRASATGDVSGFVMEFDEIDRIRKLVNELAGSHAVFTLEDIIGVSPGIQAAKRLALKAARSHSTVLITGETGTGKELFAQAIHTHSERKRMPFVAINCAAIPRELLESELFGYAEGSFTGAVRGGRPGKFELASGGTVFLDEIGDMPMDMQAKLLRVLQSGEVTRVGEHKPHPVDVRIIAATNADIRQAMRRGGFRQDLFYRLNVLPIAVPALRERPEDILPLGVHFLERRRRTLNSPVRRFTREAQAVLHGYAWPGNVRELENVVERLMNIVDEPDVGPEHLSFLEGKAPAAAEGAALLARAERQTIADAFHATGRNIAQTSRLLGISRPTLYKKLRKYRLSDRV